MSITRVITGVIGLPIVALVLIFGNQILIDIAFAVIAAMSFHEYAHAFRITNKANPLTCLGYLSCILIALMHFIPSQYLILIIGAIVPIAVLLSFVDEHPTTTPHININNKQILNFFIRFSS